MEGYWNNPVETANVLKPEGWLATGDMARMDRRRLLLYRGSEEGYDPVHLRV